MKLIHPKRMTERQEEAYRLCVASSKLALDRCEAVAAITNGLSLIESGASVVDAGLPVPGLGKIDLLADDGKGRLAVISFQNELDAKGLSVSMMRSEWVCKNHELLEHIYGRPLAPAGVRTWIFAESVLPEAAAIMRLMDRHSVSAYLCEGVGLGDESWLVVRNAAILPVEGRMQKRESSKTASGVAANKSPIQLHSVLTADEVNGFFGAHTEEEITNSGALSLRDQ